MLHKFITGSLLFFAINVYSQNPVEKFYDAFNTKNWKKFENLLHKDFKCIPDSGVIPATREEFYNNIYNSTDIWFAEWKILSMEETTPGCYLVKGTFTDEYDMWLYGAPREGLWTYCTQDGKIISLDWHDFPENPNQAQGDQKEKEFNDWIHLNYPNYSGINVYWGHDWAKLFRDLFHKYIKGKK